MLPRRSFRCAAAFAASLSFGLAPPVGAAPPAPADSHEAAGLWASDSVLDLTAFERAVLARNPSYSAMAAAVREAEARADREGALDDPTIDAGLAPRSIGSEQVATGWRASITEPLPLFGQRGLRRRAASAGTDVARGRYETARLDLIHAARTAFYDDYHYEQVRATALQTLEWMRRARTVALSRYASGSVPQQDVLAADVEISMLEHQAVAAERNRLLTESRIRALLHQDPLAPLPAPPDTLPLPGRDEAQLMIMRSNERARPELGAAEAEVQGWRARLALARRERLPGTRFGIGYDRTMTEPENRMLVMVSFEAPLSVGRHAAAEREAQAGLDGASARLEATRDELLRRITEASTRFEESVHELEVLRNGLLPATERALTASRAGYEAGRSNFDGLVRTVRDVLDARLEYHRTLASVNQSRADLERALGGPASPAGEERP
jgi:outer membrane protein, heavy metal efflux system